MALTLVPVSAPAVNFVFSPTGVITVDDSTATFSMPGATGEGFLQSRTFKGSPGTPGNGLFGYNYRIDITNIVAIKGVTCVTDLTIDFGPITPLDYGTTGTPADVYVVTGGGLGSISPTMADQSGNQIIFRFLQPPICPAGRPDESPTTYFFGLASRFPPRPTTARLTINGTSVTLPARTPAHP